MSLVTINFAVSTNEDWVDTIAIVEDPGGEDEGPADLTGSSFLMHVRKTAPTLAVMLILSTDNGRLIIEPGEEDAGKLTFYVAQDVIESIDPGTYVHDVVWTLPDGREVNFADGTLQIALGVTR